MGRLPIAAAAFSLFAASTAWALPVIDDFEAGPFSLVDVAPGGNEISNLSGLTTANVIGGARFASTFLNDGNSLTASVGSSAGDDSLTVTFGVGARGDVTLAYGRSTSLNVDLTASGADAIVIEVLAATPAATSDSGIDFGVRDTNFLQGGGPIQRFTGPGLYVVPFTELMGPDLTSVREITVQIRS